jgi:hypothetical protein
MALADWLLPLLLLAPDEHGCELFEWGPVRTVITPPTPPPAVPAV